MRTLINGTAIIAILFGVAFGQTSITDPTANFRATYDMAGVTKIYKLEADLNNDGRSDFLFAPVEPDINSQYPGWYTYIAQANGTYILAGEITENGVEPNGLPMINTKKYKVGMIDEVGKYGLLTLISGTGGQAMCQLHAIVIENNAFKDIPIGQPQKAETGYDQLAERFPTPLVPALQELTP